MSDAGEFYTEWTESYDSFDKMALNENLLRGIYAYGEASWLISFEASPKAAGVWPLVVQRTTPGLLVVAILAPEAECHVW